MLDGIPPTAKVFLTWAGGEEVLSWEGRMEVVGVREQSKLGVGTCSMGNHPWGRTSGAEGEVCTGVHLVPG